MSISKVIFRYTCFIRQYAVIVRLQNRLEKPAFQESEKLQKSSIKRAIKEFYTPYVCPGDMLDNRTEEEQCLLAGDFSNYNVIAEAWEKLKRLEDVQNNLSILRGEIQTMISRVPSDFSFTD